MKFLRLLSFFSVVILLLTGDIALSQTTVTIGAGTSSSSTRGPFQRADTNSSTVFSRWNMVYTATELAAAGIPNGATISQLNWESASSNVIVGSGNATAKIYIRNSAATMATSDTWANLTTGSDLVVDEIYNTTNNFPSTQGWMPFVFNSGFVYTGGAIEIAFDWDCSQVSTPAFSGNGAIKFRWESTAPNDLVAKKTASSSAPSTLSDLKNERANIQIVYTAPVTTVDLTFSVDMSQVTDAFTTVYISGSFNGWNGTDNPLTDQGNGIWEGTITVNANDSLEYKFQADDWTIDEVFAGGEPCTKTDGTFTNRFLAYGSMNMTIPTVCWESCAACVSSPAGPDTVTIGMGTSSSSTRGPFQRADTNSSTVFSRWNMVYTATELATAGIPAGATISQLNWESASSNVIIGTGNATAKVYIRNSAATMATSDTWANLTTGSDLVVDEIYNTTNNFPGVQGWMPFVFNSGFVYTGGAIEIAFDWDCSQVSTPAFNGNGAIKFRWESTAPNDLVAKKTASSSAPSTLSDLKNERANIQIVFTLPECEPLTMTTATVTDVTCNGADDGAVDLEVTAGVAPFTFLWSNTAADTTEDVAGLKAGMYTVVITDGDGCPYTDSVTVSEPDALVITDSIMADSAGTGIGTASIMVTGGTPPYSYMWNGTAGPADTTGLTSGTYAVQVMDANGCMDSASVEVTDVVSIADLNYVTNLTISPNPTNGITNINLELSQYAEVGVSIYSIRGKLIKEVVQKNTAQLNQQIDLSAYANGIYFVRLTINKRGVTTKKIILQK